MCSNWLEHDSPPRPVFTLGTLQLPVSWQPCFLSILSSSIKHHILYRCCLIFSEDQRKPSCRFLELFFCSSPLSGAFPGPVPIPQSPWTLFSASLARLGDSQGFSLPVLRPRKYLLVETWVISRLTSFVSLPSGVTAACCLLFSTWFSGYFRGGHQYHFLCRFLLLFV